VNLEETDTPQAPHTSDEEPSILLTDEGRTAIADVVVSKLAARATTEIAGVHRLAGSNAFATLIQRFTGARSPDGVVAEVGQRETAIDLRLITLYGANIPDVAQAVRQNVVARVAAMTGLIVKEVNIDVTDMYFPPEGKPLAEGGTTDPEASGVPASTQETIRLREQMNTLQPTLSPPANAMSAS